ncbi:MAG: type IX secretion system sortase PorU [Candidatus Azobacteroides sp.]|nr:type IX secretion system sortase PorU [Candidatus Azobacteroides sp.]
MIKYEKQRRVGVIILYLLGFISFLSAQTVNDGSRYRENSVLSSGKWIRLKVNENGIYKLTYDDIKKQGISDPAKVKIYGYGGWILAEDFTQPYVDDLPEVAVYVDKGSDGVFGPGDYLLFYGRGTVRWTYNSTRGVYEHENNPYATYGSYFMTESDTGPKEMETLKLSDASSGTVRLTVFDDYAVYEKDSVSILNSGRELFGENFVKNSGTQSFTFTIPGITSDTGRMRLSFAAAPKEATPVRLSIGDQDNLSISIYAPAPSDYYRKAYLGDSWGNWNGEKSEKVTATVTYNSSGQAVAYLNFIALNMKRSLQFYPVAYTFFRNRESLSGQNSVTYSIGNPTASCQVWEVTQNQDTRLMETELSDGRLQFTVAPSGNTLREFVMVDLSKSFPVPEFVEEIQNQNLHALPPTDMVILAPTVYMGQAEQLAEAHRQSGLRVAVAEERSVFNEFSSGTPDATAYRRFMKMFYDRATNDSDKPKYLLLFGDGLFDNRHLTSDGSKRDPKYYLLTYQVKESTTESTSYGTDDYFGFLDDSEGRNISSDRLDIGIGRFPVNTVEQAENAVNKVIAYMGNTQYGNWKSKLVFSADNTDSYDPNNYAVHATQAEQLAKYMEENYPEYMLYKYYVDAYKLVNINGKPSAPDAKKGILDHLKEGCFLLNYTGHGSTTGWSGEDLMNITDVRQMTFENLPLWITATCDFGWFDGFNASGGEEAFLNKKSGAIALYTTSRVVDSRPNYNINSQLIRYLFMKENGKHFSLGDIFRLGKNQLGSDANKLNFVLLGDPALVLNYPEWNIQLESINGNSIPENETITLRALDKVSVSGVITDETGNLADQFTGTLNATVFDSKQTIESVNSNSDGVRFSFTDYPGMIYSGNTEVKNGAFNFTFNVPLDIMYADSNGKMGLYAYDQSSGKDAVGSFLQYKLGGTGDNWENSGDGPEIVAMFLNSEDFKNGDPVNETPFFYAKVKDENGINLSGSGIGHGLELQIDNNTYPLNSYYEAVDITGGTVGFSIPELPAGNHTLIFRVWNIYNIPTVDSLNFTVVNGYRPTIVDLQANENPARTHTFFTLIYNLPETVLDVEIGVYDLSGRTVWVYSEKGSSGFSQQYQIEWPLVNGAGTRIRPGIYIYRATIRTANSKETTKAKKIIVLGQ